MDPSNIEDFPDTPELLAVKEASEAREAAEARRAQGPRHLQKRRVYNGGSAYARRRLAEGQEQNAPDPIDFGSLGDGGKARKGSLRYAVRRIFGRRSREIETPPLQPIYPSYDYAANETSRLDTPTLYNRLAIPGNDDVQRTLSAPTSMLPPSTFARPRSPYGFPSARLKPLDLGNPFATQGGSSRRRKSLPSVLFHDSDAAVVSAALEGGLSTADVGTEFPRGYAGDTAVRGPSLDKRKSRSADDLRAFSQQLTMPASPQRQKGEVRQWRDSLQGNVLRASGFTTRSPGVVPASPREGERTPLARPVELVSESTDNDRGQALTPLLQRDASIRGKASLGAFEADTSGDLEDRVARLEAGLYTFRGQLAQLSADRDRKGTMTDDFTSDLDASGGDRSPSMLASDLRQDLRPSNYQYEYTRSIRQTASPRPPRTPTHTDPSSVTPNFSLLDRSTRDPFLSPSPQLTSVRSNGNGNGNVTSNTTNNNGNRAHITIPTEYTFRSLYEMLADERSARRRLESQMRTLRQEIAELHYQVNIQSGAQSQRSSQHPTPMAMEPMIGSSRLHAILRDTEASPPNTAQIREDQSSEQYSPRRQQDLMSRFSGSESEMGGGGGVGGTDAQSEDRHTSFESYQTPVEEWRFPFSQRASGEGEMF